jgi:hypothetical protein
MTAPSPLLFEAIEDGVLAPAKRCRAEAARRFLPGQTYLMEEVQERSQATHAHYFARLHDLWMSLPDDAAMQFPTSEALRKHALVMTGFRRERKFATSSREEARKLAAWLRDGESDYAIISVKENVIIEWRPLSQSYRSMPKGQFGESKRAVLQWIEGLLGLNEEQAA